MRLRPIPLLPIVPLGLAAALMTHALLKAIADFGLGAPGFASHAHAAVEPVVCVEIVLAIWLSGLAVRDALASRAQPFYAITSPSRLGCGRFGICAGLVGLIAIATLFGMEYSESGSAAFGLGWLGGALLPGAIALLVATATAVGALYLALAGYLAGFYHLIALIAAALTRFFATLLPPARVAQRVAARRPTAHPRPVARHAGLRAPPKTTRY